MSFPAPNNPQFLHIFCNNMPTFLGSGTANILNFLNKCETDCINTLSLYDILTITDPGQSYRQTLSNFIYSAKTFYGICNIAGSVNPYELPDGTEYLQLIVNYNNSTFTQNDQKRKFDYITLENEFWNLETSNNPLISGLGSLTITTTAGSSVATLNGALPLSVGTKMMIKIPTGVNGVYRQISTINGTRTQITFDRPFNTTNTSAPFEIRDNQVNGTYTIDYETFLYRLIYYIRPLSLLNNIRIEAYISRRLTQDQYVRLIPHIDILLLETDYNQGTYPLYNDPTYDTIRDALIDCSTTRTGTISIGSNTNLIQGTATDFAKDLGIGTKIKSNGEVFTISSINVALQQASTVEIANSTITNDTFTSYFNYAPIFYLNYALEAAWMTNSNLKSYVDVYRFHALSSYSVGTDTQVGNSPISFNDETNPNVTGATNLIGLSIFARTHYQSTTPVAPSPIPCPSCISTASTIDDCFVTASTTSNCLIADFTNPSCDGVCNGTISASTTYGVAPFTYYITGLTTSVTYSSSTGYFENLCADTYQLCVEDSLTNIECYYQNITLVNSFYANINSFLNGFCVTITGGTQPYNLFLDNTPLIWNYNNITNCYSADCNTLSVITVTDSSS